MDETGEALLNEILSSNNDDERPKQSVATQSAPQPMDDGSDEKIKKILENHSQWALGGNGRFMPVGATAPTLPSGVYETFAIPGLWGVEKLDLNSDGIYILPDMATQTVLKEAEKFWVSKDKYRQHKLLYKRGIIMWGPPGSGKTVCLKLLIEDLIKRDGIVLLVSNVQLATVCLKAIRRIEPERNLIVVFEDIDEIINYNGESGVLSMLDGENNVDNILHIATTNYPDRLGARIINRPSRFDRRVYVGMPEEAARRSYLEKATGDGLRPDDLIKWVRDTKEMSIAHLRELVAAVYCLDQPYDEVITRLRDMAKVIVSKSDGFAKKDMGFKNRVVEAINTPDVGGTTGMS